MSTTIEFAPATVQAIAHVGQVVTYQGKQYTVHSVEGDAWYAFNDNGQTVIDKFDDATSWYREPTAYLIPAGQKVGDGWGTEVALTKVKRGVCLEKPWR